MLKLTLLSLILVPQLSHAVDFVKEVKSTKAMSAAALRASSYCEWGEGQNPNQIKGYRQNELVNIASVSKIFTSYLATTKFGPMHRFTTGVTIVPVQKDIYDVQLSGSGDPYFTDDKLFLLISELNRQGVFYIRNLYFDQGVRMYLTFRENKTQMWKESTSYPGGQDFVHNLVSDKETLLSLQSRINTSKWSKLVRSLYIATRTKAITGGIAMAPAPKMIVKNINFGATYSSGTPGAKTFVMYSKPLFEYLKDMNKYSINFIADQIFLLSGGLPAMNQLLLKRVGLSQSEFSFHTGSGLPTRTDDGRDDNRVTCAGVLKTIESYADYLSAIDLTPDQEKVLGHKGISLADILLVSGTDSDATFSGAGDGSVVVKTGTLPNAANLAGYADTHDGTEYFGMFLYKEPKASLTPLKRHIVSLILKEHKGPRKVVAYESSTFNEFLSFDVNAKFQEAKANLVASN